MKGKSLAELLEWASKVKPLPFAEWVEMYRCNERGEKLGFEFRPYLRQLYEDTSPRICIMKAAQVGGTEYAISRALYFLDYTGGTVIYTFPTKTDVFDFVDGRFDPGVAHSPYLARRIAKPDNKQVKRFGKGFIYFRGSFSIQQTLSIPSDFNIHDEIDFSKPAIKELYAARLDASEYALQLDISTPTIPNFGIDRLYKSSDQQTWFTPCPACSWEGEIDYFEMLDRDKLVFRCPTCGEVLDRMQGRWVPKYPDRELRGYSISQTFAPFRPVYAIVEREKNPNITPRQFKNFSLGIPTTEGVGNVSRAVIMENCFTEGYDRELLGSGDLLMGVDQGPAGHYAVVAKLDGSLFKIVSLEFCNNWEELSHLIGIYKPKNLVIDWEPERHAVEGLQSDFPQVIPCDYVPLKTTWKFKDEVLQANRSQIIDLVSGAFMRGEVKLYEADENTETYIAHWESLARVVSTGKDGNLNIRWVNTSPDHYAHATVYAYLAKLIFGGASSVSGESMVAFPKSKPTGFMEMKW